MKHVQIKNFGLFLIANLILDSGCKPEKKQTPNDPKKKEAQADPVKTTKSEEAGSPQGFLTRQDTSKPGNLREIPEEELGEMLNGSIALYPDESKSDKKNCFEDDLERSTFKLQNKWLTLQLKNDYSDCLSTGSKSFEEFGVRGFYYFKSEGSGADLANLDGKKAGYIKSFLKKNESIRILYRDESELKIRGNDKDTDFAYRKIITSSGQDGGPCERKDSVTIFCEFRMITIHNKLKNQNIYDSVKLNNVRGKEGDTFFSSGTAEFELNNWRGKVTFRGTNTPPTWTATNGKDKASGMLKQRSKDD
jgi:hypothetical protein